MQPIATRVFVELPDGNINVESDTEDGVYTTALKEVSILEAAQAQADGNIIYLEVDYALEWPWGRYDFVECEERVNLLDQPIARRRFAQGTLVITPRMALI